MARRALELVPDGGALGLGSGRAARAFVRVLAARVRAGLQIRCVSTSRATEDLARELGIPLVSLEEVGQLDLAVDGADEIAPSLDLIKGYGGALVREMIVASAARRLVILAEPEKLVRTLGERGTLPVEIVPFGWSLGARRLDELGHRPRRRGAEGAPFLTDNGNHILDCSVAPIADAAELERQIQAIPGVVGTGLFLGMAETVFLEDERGGVSVLRRAPRSGKPDAPPATHPSGDGERK